MKCLAVREPTIFTFILICHKVTKTLNMRNAGIVNYLWVVKTMTITLRKYHFKPMAYKSNGDYFYNPLLKPLLVFSAESYLYPVIELHY